MNVAWSQNGLKKIYRVLVRYIAGMTRYFNSNLL